MNRLESEYFAQIIESNSSGYNDEGYYDFSEVYPDVYYEEDTYSDDASSD